MSKKIDCYFNFLWAYNAELVNSCITNCVFTILQIENIKTPMLYFNCSLCFCVCKAENMVLGYSYSCAREILVMDYSNHVIEHNNLELYSYEELWEVHKTNLRNGKPIVLLCDLYYLDYYKNLRKEHRLHGIIAYAIDEEEKNIYIIDNGSQFYNGTIAVDDFKKSWTSEYFDNKCVTDAEILSNKVWFEVITENWKDNEPKKMLSVNLQNTIDCYYNSEPNDEIIYGLAGLETVLQRFQLCYEKESDMSIVLKELKDIIFEAVNRMKWNKAFIISVQQETQIPELNNYICRIESDLSQWNAFYNLLLKGNVIFNDALYQKIVYKFAICLKNEHNRELMTKKLAQIVRFD